MSTHSIYWISTSLVSAFLVLSAASYFFHENTIEGVKALGFPDFFRIQLGILKVIAVVVLLVPQMPLQVKEWAYAGIGLFLLTAIVAHAAHRDPIGLSVINVALFGILVTSNIYLHRWVGSQG